MTNLTGTASININGTVGATTPSTGAFTTLSATGLMSGVDARWTTSSNTIDIQSNPAALGVPTIGFQTAGTITTGSAFIYGNSSRVVINGPTAGEVSLRVANSVVAVASSTGLAVTGALSATGEIASFGSSGTVNNRLKASYNSGSGVALFGPDSNGGTTSLNIGVSNAGTYNTVLGVSTTGLAVTGALSSTGALAIGNTVATAVAVASTHKVTIVIGGVTYYLLATNV